MGNCPNAVNMAECCTLQEPIALVLEYIPNGDLLRTKDYQDYQEAGQQF